MKSYLNNCFKIFAILSLVILPVMFSACDTSKKEKEKDVQKTSTKGVDPVVLISTNLGDFKIKLDGEKAPVSVENFLAYTNEGFYDGVIFHRVIPNFMIQTGGLTDDMKQKSTKSPIKNEADNGLPNIRGSVAMARTSDVNSATSQFFINVNDNDFLNNGERDFGYAVFGEVVDGMDTVDKIAAVETGSVGYFRDVPKEPVVIKSVTVIEGK
ncbi:MAG: peptidylprolyl isomerase [Thermodesulfobacteriota bacterium]